MTWTPVNPAHAIERVRFLTKFREKIPGKLLRQIEGRVSEQQSKTRLNGPIPLNGLNLTFQVTPDGQPQFSEPSSPQAGVQFSRSSASGNVLETLAIVGDQIIYETVDYRRWETFKKRFETVVSEALNMATSTLDVDQLSLEYFDQFFFAGASIDAKPGDLLVGLNGMLHDDAVSGRTLFHLHRGWYEKGDEGDILVNQNFDASDEMPMGETKTPKRVVRILTKVDLRAGMYPVDEGRIMERLDLLHDLSKDYFKKAVQPAILQSVGIVDKN